MKNFIWGLLLFVSNLFILYLNYTKNFSIPKSFFVEANQMMSFVIGIIYAQQYKKFDVKNIIALMVNSITFSVLTTILFSIYGASVNVKFTFLVFTGMFICTFISYTLYYWMFCPTKYKKEFDKKSFEKSLAKRKLKKNR